MAKCVKPTARRDSTTAVLGLSQRVVRGRSSWGLGCGSFQVGIRLRLGKVCDTAIQD